MTVSRREMLGLLGAAALPGWESGDVDHLLPSVNHERLLLKASFARPLAAPPRLTVAGKRHDGKKSDSAGQFWSFDVAGLAPERDYELALADAKGKRLCEPWTIRTFPAPDSRPARFRLMIYTCAGGHPALVNPADGSPSFLSLETRQAMLRNGLAWKPDAVIAIGDHVYWDLRVGRPAQLLGRSEVALKLVGEFDRAAPVFGTSNERKLKLAVHPQIAALYGTLFRSTPVFFVQDDHDYFENDEAHPDIVTFPPDAFMLRMARATQKLYYPEFLPDANRPLGLPGASAEDRGPGLSESFGTLRWGKLAEILIYDCRRFLSLAGPAAGYVPETAEQWLLGRLRSRDTAHLAQVPSLPLAWSAGKWGDWYPDVLDDSGRLGTARAKYFWQSGWLAQHDRLVEAASRREGIPLFLCGDLHAHGHARILRSGKLDLRRNPVEVVLTGPVSTGPIHWPSAARGTPPHPSTVLDVDEQLKATERNGFSIVDFTPEAIELRSFAWKLGEPEDGLRQMEPFRVARLERRV